SAREEGGPQAEVILRTHGKTGVGEPRIDIGSLPRLRGRVGVGVRPSQWADVDRGRGFRPGAVAHGRSPRGGGFTVVATGRSQRTARAGGSVIDVSRGDRPIALASAGNSQRGFTLLEILLATTLLAAGLALGFATLRAATATVDRGEALADRTERMRAVEGFLRRRLASATPIAFAIEDDTGRMIRFIGEPDRVRFVADLPNYLGRGGPHLHDIAVLDGDGGQRLAVSFAMAIAGGTIEDRNARPPESLVPDLTD